MERLITHQTIMSFVAIAVTVVSAAVTAYSQQQAGDAAQEAADYNADVQDQRADSQRTTMIENLRRQKDDRSRYMAGLNVHQAASGVLTDTGTPVLMREEIGSRLDERISDYTNQALASESYMRSQAYMTRFGGEQAQAAADIQSVGTILGGIGDSAGYYNQYGDNRK